MKNDQLPIPYSDAAESIPPGEATDILQVVDAVKQLLAHNTKETGRFHADVHVKTHGYAQGKFSVLPNLPDELAQGLFQQAGEYAAIVRFSNSASRTLPDAVPDGRGMAFKVLGIKGEMLAEIKDDEPAQDFVMINHPVFFAANARDFLRLQQVVVTAEEKPIAAAQEALTGGDWNPLNWHWRELLKVTQIVGHLPAHPAANTYFSMSPFRYGQYVAKFRVKPMGERHDSYLQMVKRLSLKRDAMRLALEQTLQSEQVMFEFQVQLQTSAETMPVEDATVQWPESESPYRTVAYLLLPRQEIALFRLQEYYRDLAFNVWHCLAAHRPLGGINRVRRDVYPVSAAWRRQATWIS
jgi:catalase